MKMYGVGMLSNSMIRLDMILIGMVSKSTIGLGNYIECDGVAFHYDFRNRLDLYDLEHHDTVRHGTMKRALCCISMIYNSMVL